MFGRGLLPRRALHERWAGRRGDVGSPAIRWSAWNGSLYLGPSPHRWQWVALSRMNLALR